MPIVSVLVVIAVVGVLMWLVTTYIPMPPPFKQILLAVVVIALVLWLLNVFGLLTGLGTVGSVRIR